MKQGMRRYPKWVSAFTDRHGIVRLRFRRTGSPSHYFQSAFGTGSFEAEYQACLLNEPSAPADAWPVGSVGYLVHRYYQSQRWARLKPASKKKYGRILDKFCDEYGLRSAARLKAYHVDAIIAKMLDTPAAAADLRKALSIVFRWAKKFELLKQNVIADTDPVRQKKGGWYTWTDEDIARFRSKWPLRTNQRAALELTLWTAGRRSDVHTLGPSDIRGGWLYFTQEKTDKGAAIFIVPELELALSHVAQDAPAFILNRSGQPYTAESFSNWFRKARKAAGLDVGPLHGVRKAAARRLAEARATDAEGAAILGHDSAVFAEYRAAANSKDLARSGLNKVVKAQEDGYDDD